MKNSDQSVPDVFRSPMASGVFKAAFSLLLMLSAASASALAPLSRACRFGDIPGTLKAPALVLFQYLGMPATLADLDRRTSNEQANYWILESITTDYGSLRYYLFAENRVYWKYSYPGEYYPRYYLEFSYKSPWAAQSLDPQIFPDSRLSIFNFNRKVLFSARAGDGEIVKKHVNSGYQTNDAVVVGKHYYYDPVSKAQAYLGETYATDCNLGNWGLEDR